MMLQLHILKTTARIGWIILIATLAICFMVPAVLADHNTALADQNFALASRNIKIYYSWLNSPWSDSDLVYQKLREKIDTDLSKSSASMSVVQKYKVQSEKNPSNPQALFAYCYSVYKTTGTKGTSYIQSQINSGSLYEAIVSSKVQVPHTYNYARLAFLETAFLKSPKSISIGKRLIKHSPNDSEVKIALATVLTFSTVPADRSLALKYQQDLATRFPGQPGPYQLLGLIYYRTAWLNHSQEDANKSIAAYQKALDLSPKSSQVSLEYNRIIDFIKNLQVQWKQNK